MQSKEIGQFHSLVKGSGGATRPGKQGGRNLNYYCILCIGGSATMGRRGDGVDGGG